MIYEKQYTPPSFNRREALRYAGCKVGEEVPEVSELLEDCLQEMKDRWTCKVCWSFFRVDKTGEQIDMEFMSIRSADLTRYFEGCEETVVFVATVGHEIDRCIRKYSHISPSKALMFQAIGAERVESLCDCFCRDIEEEIKSKGCEIRPRFSPGFGDVPLSVQEDIFRALEPPRHVGVALNTSLLMSPSKSVSAFIGIRKRDEDER